MIAGNTRELIELGVIRPIAKPIKVKPAHNFRGSSFKLFKDARYLVRSKKFKSIKEYKQYMYISGIAGVPDAPDIVYRNKGWKNYNDWIGLKKNKDKTKKIKFSQKKKSKKIRKKVRSINIKKHIKFNELLKNRMSKALKSIRLIGNLSNKNAYIYYDEDVNLIVNQLKESLKKLKSRFNHGRL